MSTTITAMEAGEAWLEYVADTLMLGADLNRPEVEEEYKRLESTDSFTKERELWRNYTDNLIDKILRSSPETRQELLARTDARSLAYVQDRIHCGTELLTAFVQKGLQLDIAGTESLPDFFRQILLQEQA